MRRTAHSAGALFAAPSSGPAPGRERRRPVPAAGSAQPRNWIAAHIRERRYELDLTQQQVGGGSRDVALVRLKLERGDHILLDEELLIGIERRIPDEEPERERAPVPELLAV